MNGPQSKEAILSVRDLVIHFSTDHGYVQAVRGISFDLYKGDTLCIVGESGSGKSVTCKAIMGILAANGRLKGGSIMYEGEDLTKISEDDFHRIRGNKIGMIFQDPLSSLNPIVRIGKQITEVMLINGNRLKKLYNDKISEELIAYKNAKTQLRSGIANARDRIDFLKIDKKKVADNYGVHHNKAEGRLYTAKQNYLAARQQKMASYHDTLSGIKAAAVKERRALSEADADPKKIEAVKLDAYEKIKATKLARKSELNELRTQFLTDAVLLRQDVKAEKKANAVAVKKLRRDYDEEVKKARAEYHQIARELRKKYRPLIKTTHETFKNKARIARLEVRKYKAELTHDYKNKKAELRARLHEAESEHARLHLKHELRQLRLSYISSLRVTRREAKERAIKVMREVGIPEPERRFRQYPFEFSGGMRQRIVIAIALTADPDILICDEPTTALDVTIQAQILELINDLKRSRNLSCIFVTHDLGVVANMADRVAVMYAGKIVEQGTADEIFYDPRHPYTWALLSSIPDIDSKERLDAIPGTPPNMIYPPKGDAFALRSKYALAVDFKKEPPLFKITDTHYAATWLLDPRAPKVEMPSIVSTRIRNALHKRQAREKKDHV